MNDWNKKEMLEKIHLQGFRYEQRYKQCPQATLSAIQDGFGIVGDEVIKAAHIFAGGTARTGRGTCGALAGGLMALASKWGRDRKYFDHGIDRHYPEGLAKKLCDRFTQQYGSIICNHVHKKIFGRTFDLWDPKEYEEFEKAGAHKDKCPEVVGVVASWTAEILLEEGVRPKGPKEWPYPPEHR